MSVVVIPWGGCFASIVEEGEHSEVFVVGERVEFVGVALCALGGDSKDAFADGVDAVEKSFDSELLGFSASFFMGHGVAELAGSLLVAFGRRSPVFDDELIVSEVVVE